MLDPTQLLEGDCQAILPTLPSASIACVITSPPYNQGASPAVLDHPGSSRGAGKHWDGYGPDSDALPEQVYQDAQVAVLTELHRVTQPGGFCWYVHKDRLWRGELLSPLQWLYHTPWYVRQQIVWDRRGSQRHDGWHFVPVHEYVFWLVKGATAPNLGRAREATSIWAIPMDRDAPWHPAPFPRALAARCLAASALPRDALVLDPYLGSGTTGVACAAVAQPFCGIERYPDYLDRARLRIARAHAAYQPPLMEMPVC